MWNLASQELLVASIWANGTDKKKKIIWHEGLIVGLVGHGGAVFRAQPLVRSGLVEGSKA